MDTLKEFKKTFVDDIGNRRMRVDKELYLSSLTPERFEKLRTVIPQTGELQKDFREKLPQKWLPLEDAISERQKTHGKVLPTTGEDSLDTINHALDVSLTQQELEAYIKFKHSHDHHFYFQDEKLREYLILNHHDWMIDTLQSFTLDKPFERDVQKRKNFSDLALYGIITDENREEIWSQPQFSEMQKYSDHTLKVMENLDIIVRPKRYRDGHTLDLPFYFVPRLVKNDKPDHMKIEDLPEDTTTKFTLAERYPLNATFSRLLTRCLALWPVHEDQLFSGCCILTLDMSHTMLLTIEGNSIVVSINHNLLPRWTSKNLFRNIKTFCEESLDEILDTYENVHCSTQRYKVEPDLKEDQGTDLRSTGLDSDDSGQVKHDFADRRTEIPSDQLLDQMADNIGSEMVFVALELGLDGEKIKQIEEDEPRNTVKRNRLMLKHWKQSFPLQAKTLTLADAFLNVNRDIYEALKRLGIVQEEKHTLTTDVLPISYIKSFDESVDYGKYKSETPTPFVEDLPTGIALIQYYKGGKGPYSGTGFRVGEKYIMTAYHVFRERIEHVWRRALDWIESKSKISRDDWHKIAKGLDAPGACATPNEDPVEKLLEYLTKEGKWYTGHRNLSKLIRHLGEIKGTTHSNELESFISSKLEESTPCIAQFNFTEKSTKPGSGQDRWKYLIQYDIPYGSQKDDVLILELKHRDQRKPIRFPKRFVFGVCNDQEFVIFGHPRGEILQVDPHCKRLTHMDIWRLMREKDEAWSKVPGIDQAMVDEGYSICEDHKSCLFHASKSTSHGASGAPGIVHRLDRHNRPAVSLMYLRGYPQFYYHFFSGKKSPVPNECLVEFGITMGQVAMLLLTTGSHETRKLYDDLLRLDESAF